MKKIVGFTSCFVNTIAAARFSQLFDFKWCMKQTTNRKMSLRGFQIQKECVLEVLASKQNLEPDVEWRKGNSGSSTVDSEK